MAKKIMFLSGRGGTGKTTVCAEVGKRLAQMGKKTLIEEADFGFGCLDLILDIKNETIFDLKDALLYPENAETAICKCEENLDLIKPPYDSDFKVCKEQILKLNDYLDDKYDFILIDTGGRYANIYQPLCETADMILLFTEPDTVCIRSCEKAAEIIRNFSNAETGLIINKVKSGGKNDFENFDEIIDKIGFKIIGILPYYENSLKGVTHKNRRLWKKSINNLCLRLNNFNICLAIM